MASFGEEPGNAARGSASWPTRSALIGLIGAALGVGRGDRVGQAALAAQYRFVIRADRQGTLLRDFHTYQSLPSAKGKPATRAAALCHPEVVTSITRRDYLCDVAYHIAMRCVDDTARWQLETVAEALKRPAYILCLGRRSCPPGVGQIFYLLNSRFFAAPALTAEGLFGNRIALAAIAVCLALQLLITYAPFMNLLFDTEPLDLIGWAYCIGVGAGVFVLVEAEKALIRAGRHPFLASGGPARGGDDTQQAQG